MPLNENRVRRQKRLWRLEGALVLLASQVIAQPPKRLPRRPGSAITELKVVTDDAVHDTWQVIGAELNENPAVTEGIIRIKNVSLASIAQARFYAEYYDAAGRECLTLAFTSDQGQAVGGTSIEPGTTRELRTLAVGLSPALEPVLVRISLVSQTQGSGGGSARVGAVGVTMRTPAMAAAPSTAAWHKVQLDLDGLEPPIVDLILARVTVSSTGGEPQSVQILNSLNDDVRAWFNGFVEQLSFAPATIGFHDVPDQAVLLIRAIKSSVVDVDPTTLLTRHSRWVREYVSGNADAKYYKYVPPVTEILFEREPLIIAVGPGAELEQKKLDASPEEYDLSFAASEWSVLRRELINRPSGLRWATLRELHR